MSVGIEVIVTFVMRAFFLCLLASMCAIYAQAESQWAEIRDPDGFTNVREGKSADSRIVARIQVGERFQAEPSKESWWFVQASDGRKGYVHRSRIHLQEAPTATPLGQTWWPALIDDPDGSTWIRSGMSTGTSIVGQVKRGVQFMTEPSTNAWWKVVTSDGIVGYMHKSRVRLLVSDVPTVAARSSQTFMPPAPAQLSAPNYSSAPTTTASTPADNSDVFSPHLYSSGTPLLCIEPKMHTNDIHGISTETTGRVMLTVSNDKTARLWEIGSGRLLRVFRVPVGPGFQGRLYAGALSPDGTVAAISGYTGTDHAKIYLLETASGHQRSIGELPDASFNLAFSPTGHFLAGVGGGWGLRVWETSTGREIARDADYTGEDTYGLDWFGEERLATGSWDGNVRVYLGTELTAAVASVTGPLVWKPAARAQVKGGGKPFCVRFSPDGKMLAIGFSDTPKVAVMDGARLSFLYAPDTSGITNGDLSSLAWNDDGTVLVAGGRWNVNGKFPIRAWAQSGLGPFRDVSAADDTIVDLRASLNHSFLFASGEPTWGILNLNFRVTEVQAASLVSYWNHRQCQFSLAHDGSAIGVQSSDFAGKDRIRFSIPKRTLELVSHEAAWEWSGRTQKMAARPLRLPTNARGEFLKPILFPSEGELLEIVESTDSQGFIAGTKFMLHSYTAEGENRWVTPAPSRVCGLNLTSDNKILVGAFADGTIRWYRMTDGQELLALFLPADGKRWVLWTPEGYYDGAPGAEDLLGWVLNRGPDQSCDFFSVSRFRAVFYRPDVIQRVLETLDVTEALRLANHALGRPESKPEEIRQVITRLAPPVVELETGDLLRTMILPAEVTHLVVRYRVRQTGAEACSKVMIRFNGRLVDVTAPAPKNDEISEVIVPLPVGVSGELSIFAEHQLTVSEPAVLRIERKPSSVAPHKPRLFLITTGVSRFEANHPENGGGNESGSVGSNPSVLDDASSRASGLILPDLIHASDDARNLADSFRLEQGRLYEQVIVRSLTDRNATTEALRDAFREVARQAKSEDVAVVFFSGHGIIDSKSGFYLATYETDLKAPTTTALTGTELSKLLEGIKARTVLVLDTCHSAGALSGTQLGRIVSSPSDLTGFVNKLSSAEQGTVVLSSSGATEQSLEDAEQGGVFTQAFCEGLVTKPVAGRSEPVTCRRMQDWLIRRVPELVAALVKGAPDAPRQTPVCVIPKGVPDFALAKP